MRVLAIDTAFDACSVAAWERVTVSARSQSMARGQAEALLPMVETVLSEAGWGVSALHLIAVTHGPGAFTGLRIGLAAARGLALATGSPCVGVGTLEAIAQAVAASSHSGRPLLVAMPSKRQELYAQMFDAGGVALTDPLAVRAEAMRSAFPLDVGVDVAGEGADAVAAALRRAGIAAAALEGPRSPPADAVAAVAAARWRETGAPAPPPMPLYLRPADTGPVRRPARRS